MKQERRQVLEMLAQGRITAEDAERLLERLQDSPDRAGAGAFGPGVPGDAGNQEASGAGAGAGARAGAGAGGGAGNAAGAGAGSGRLKYLRILVSGKGRDQVNVRMPLTFVKAGVRLATVLPAPARRKLEEKGIDLEGLSRLEGEELEHALRALRIEVDSDGEVVRVFCE